MKTIDTNGISYIEPVPGGTAEWYYGISNPAGDLYEAEELFRVGQCVRGNSLCLIRYPDGAVFRAAGGKDGTCLERPVFLDGRIAYPCVDFVREKIRIFSFDCGLYTTELLEELPLGAVRNCYNLQLHTAPLCLTRQGDEGLFEIIWPERAGFPMDPHESFFLRDGGRLYFNKWHEEGEGADYRYWEETVIRDLGGNTVETLPGDVMIMPDGEMWCIR